uniref:Uncharacterized protein n=1 Tax=Candidatus Methanogaster sp. ANME-2c ERB4 TaxID=2759911 RepID=A0A7G9YKR5_9EURY|nr:hypothetical protein LKGCFIDI_00001 [Methanosarcinales archaeon ANME-2c ERB4]
MSIKGSLTILFSIVWYRFSLRSASIINISEGILISCGFGLIRYRITIGMRLKRARSASGFANAIPVHHPSSSPYSLSRLHSLEERVEYRKIGPKREEVSTDVHAGLSYPPKMQIKLRFIVLSQFRADVCLSDVVRLHVV